MILEKSVNMKWPDFEDAVQSATAEAIHADYIVTRNIKDFVKSKLCSLHRANCWQDYKNIDKIEQGRKDASLLF